MQTQQKVILLGHSFIRRLGQFMAHSRYANLGLREAVVQCFGVGGTRITERTRQHITRVVEIRCCLNADLIVIHLGENDY